MTPFLLALVLCPGAPVPKQTLPPLTIQLDSAKIRVGDPLLVRVIARPDRELTSAHPLAAEYGTLVFEVCKPGESDYVDVPAMYFVAQRPHVRRAKVHAKGVRTSSLEYIYAKDKRPVFDEAGSSLVRAALVHSDGRLVSEPVEVRVAQLISGEAEIVALLAGIIRVPGDKAERIDEWLAGLSDSSLRTLLKDYKLLAGVKAAGSADMEKQVRGLLDATKSASENRRDYLLLLTAGHLVGRQEVKLAAELLSECDPTLVQVAALQAAVKERDGIKPSK